MSQIYTSDNASTGFDATSSGSLPAGWTAVTGTWQAGTSNPLPGHSHTLKSTTAANNDKALYTAGGTAADMEVVLAQTQSNTFSGGTDGLSAMCIWLRSDIGGNNGYLVLLGNSGSGAINLYVFKHIGGADTAIAQVLPANYSLAASGDILLIRAQIIGSAIKARTWKSTSPEPTSWDVSITDSSWATAGYAGIHNSKGSGGQASAVNTASDFAVDTVNSSTSFINLSPTAITSSGGNITVSGTYGGTAPSAIDYNVDGGSWTAASSPGISGGNFSFSIAAPASGYHVIGVRDHTTTTTTDSGIYAVNAATTTTIAPNNAALVYSPYNWLVNGTNAVSVNPGAYFKTLFSGTSCVLNFDVSLMQSPASQIWWRIDSGPWTQATLAATVTLTIPAITSGNADTPYHFLEVIFKSMDSSSNSVNRWNTGATGVAIKFTGLTIGLGASVQAPALLAKNVLIYGDSVAEAIRSLGEADANTCNDNDARVGWAYMLGATLGCEVGVIGFGGVGYTSSFGSVPVLGSSYNLIFQGQSRSFSPAPDLIVVNHGANDGGASSGTIQTDATTVINALLAATPSTTKIVVMEAVQTYTGKSTVDAGLAAAVSAIASARVSYLATPGVFNTAYGSDSLNLHPAGPNNQGLITPALAGLLSPFMPGGSGPAPAGGFVIGAS